MSMVTEKTSRLVAPGARRKPVIAVLAVAFQRVSRSLPISAVAFQRVPWSLPFRQWLSNEFPGHCRFWRWPSNQFPGHRRFGSRRLIPFHEASCKPSHSGECAYGRAVGSFARTRRFGKSHAHPAHSPTRSSLTSPEYLGLVVGEYSEWHPLVERGRLFPEDLDETDPWQFKNVRVV